MEEAKQYDDWSGYISVLEFARYVAGNAIEEIVHGNAITPCQYCLQRSLCSDSLSQKNMTCKKFLYDIFYETMKA